MKPDVLLIFGDTIGHIYNHKELIKHYEQYYSVVTFIKEQDSIRGFHDVDILFLNGWWNRRETAEILDVLYVYMSRRNCIIGDKRYVPPYFLQEYNKNKDVEEVSRFELLDL